MSYRLVFPAAAFAAALALQAIAPASVQAQSRTIVNIGTAGVGGGWYPTGGYVCNLVHRTRDSQGHQIRCTVESTAGTVANIRSLHRGDLDIAFLVSNGLHDAYNGESTYGELGAMQDLRYVMSFHNDYQHLVARADSGIKHFRDIKGKRVNTAAAASGSKRIAHLIMSYVDLKPADLSLETSLTAREQAQALCDNKVDAFFYETGAGAASIQEATNTCDTVIAAIDGPEIDRLVADHGYYAKGEIPAGTYRGQAEAVPTFAEATVLAAKASLDADVVYHMVKAIFDNFDDFKRQSVLYQQMTREQSVVAGRSNVPYHEGAERYYREVGLLK